jgi:hypothetical protein
MNSRKSGSSRPADSNSDGNGLPATVLEPLKHLAVDLNRITEAVAKVENGHVGNLRTAIARFRETLMTEVQGIIKKDGDAQMKTAMLIVREEFDAHIQATTAEFQAEKERLTKELDELKRGGSSEELQAEIDRTSRILSEIAEEMARMLEDPDIELAKVVKENAAQNELRAYMRGLMYQLNRARTRK